MRYAVIFEDDPEKADERARHMDAHLGFLERNADHILSAGPLFDGTDGAGGLWIVEAETRDAVDRLIRDDPFWPTGLRRSVRVLAWRRVFADGARLI